MTPAPPKRVLLVDDDALVLGVAGDLLHSGGYAVQLLMYPTLTVPTAQQFKPDVVILDVNMPVLNGREVLVSLRAFEATAKVPVIFLTSPLTPREQLRSFFLGAVDVWATPFDPAHVDRLGEVFAHLEAMAKDPPPGPRERLRALLLAFFAREKSNGSLVVNPGTPFEGRAIFKGGALEWARMGPLTDTAAVDEMVSLEDGTWRWEDGVVQPPTPSAPRPTTTAGYRARVLLVDDDPSLRKLYALQLERAGFEVVSADHGEDGLRRAVESPFDMMVADLNMPVLDGWGMLKLLKGSPRTRELPVLVLSAHDDYRETLRAARAGAHDYLRKTGHADELIRRVRTLAAPRIGLFETLRAGLPVPQFEVDLVGAQWLLRTLGEEDCTGTLEATDDWAAYTLKVEGGHLLEGAAEAGPKVVVGRDALGAFLVSRGALATFTPTPPGVTDPGGEFLVELVDDTCRQLTLLEQRLTDQRLEQATRFTVDPDLANLFEQIGTDADLRILRAIVENQVEPSGLAAHLNLPQDSVDAGLKELLRRGVVRL